MPSIQKQTLSFIQLRAAFLLFFISLHFSVKTEAFTNIQTSTSVGLFNDYKKTRHYQIFHSWSIKGFYSNGAESSLEFYLNNDFSQNQWSVYPTQANLRFPIFNSELNSSTRSEVRLGRQLYTEGFDLAILDGVQIPMWWSAHGGLMPIFGYLRSTDFDQAETDSRPLVGLVLWDSFKDISVRAGATARQQDLKNKNIFASAQYQFENLIWLPAIFARGEWLAETMDFNQSSSELMLHFSDSLDGRIAYANLDPRPINELSEAQYVYRLFSISPTETVMSDLTWAKSDDVVLTASVENSFYNSGFQDETANSQSLTLDYQLASGHWISPSATVMKSYGGEVKDFGIRYTSDLSTTTKLVSEFDVAYLKKINQIEGWAQHLRNTFETHIWDRAKVGFAVELERNHYYIFDARAQVYVTNYL